MHRKLGISSAGPSTHMEPNQQNSIHSWQLASCSGPSLGERWSRSRTSFERQVVQYQQYIHYFLVFSLGQAMGGRGRRASLLRSEYRISSYKLGIPIPSQKFNDTVGQMPFQLAHGLTWLKTDCIQQQTNSFLIQCMFAFSGCEIFSFISIGKFQLLYYSTLWKPWKASQSDDFQLQTWPKW